MDKKQQLKEKIQKYIKDYELRKIAWENVKFNTKKDGTQFQKLSMAISGANFGKYYPVEDREHPYLTVWGNFDGTYITDHLAAFIYADELPDTDERKKYLTHSFVRQTTPKTLEELKQSVKDTVLKYEHYIEKTKKELELVDVFYDKYINIAKSLRKELDEDLGNPEYTTLFFAIRDDIKNIF